MSLAEWVSAKPLPDPCQPHSVACSVVRSMSVAWCCSQSASQPNCCPIHVSRIVSLAGLSDLCQPHNVARRVRLSQTVARSMSVAWCRSHSVARRVVRSMSAAWCRSQSESQPNRCLIYVSRIVSLAVLSDLCQPYSVIRSVVRSMSATWCHSQSESQPNRCPIYVSRMMLFAEYVSAKPLPDPRHFRGCTKSVSRQYENEGENEGGRGCSQIKTKSLI